MSWTDPNSTARSIIWIVVKLWENSKIEDERVNHGILAVCNQKLLKKFYFFKWTKSSSMICKMQQQLPKIKLNHQKNFSVHQFVIFLVSVSVLKPEWRYRYRVSDTYRRSIGIGIRYRLENKVQVSGIRYPKKQPIPKPCLRRHEKFRKQDKTHLKIGNSIGPTEILENFSVHVIILIMFHEIPTKRFRIYLDF
jgi:hypothetical protein